MDKREEAVQKQSEKGKQEISRLCEHFGKSVLHYINQVYPEVPATGDALKIPKSIIADFRTNEEKKRHAELERKREEERKRKKQEKKDQEQKGAVSIAKSLGLRPATTTQKCYRKTVTLARDFSIDIVCGGRKLTLVPDFPQGGGIRYRTKFRVAAKEWEIAATLNRYMESHELTFDTK